MQKLSGEIGAKMMTAELADRLLAWYDRNGRQMPWRVRGNGGVARADPYQVWLSEIMLQQTTVAAVIPYFHRFLQLWPQVQALAGAGLDDVLRAWAGLGYYARARNLHKCAGIVAAEFDGRFPEDETSLKALPGIGDYTAAAISAIAFGRPANVVDGNVQRVIARLRIVAAPLPAARNEISELAGEIAPQSRPGDYAQALMDLGATVCTAKSPDCGHCPWGDSCQAHAAGRAEEYPRRAAKRPKPVRRGIAYWIERDNRVLLERRPDHGLLGGMLCFPGSAWTETDIGSGADKGAPLLPGEVRHTFTHFHLILRISAGHTEIPPSEQAGRSEKWVRISDLEQVGLPSVMRKVARHAIGAMAAAD